MNLCSFCCYCDHFLILPGFPLSHRPSHTPLNMSVEISWYCLILDRSPSTVCRVRASVIHWKFKLLLVWGFSLLCPPLRHQASSLPSNLQIHTCRFPLGSTRALLQALSWYNRQELHVCPHQPRLQPRLSLCCHAPRTCRLWES